MALHLGTPLVVSRALSARTGKSISLKLECLQPTGSFKIRGIGAACEYQVQHGKKRFVSSSGGNAGIAVAYAGRRLSIPVTVVVPETTTQIAKDLIRLEDAEIVVHGASWQEANEYALSLLDGDTAFLHPFDDPVLWAGHATIIEEVARLGGSFDAVVLSVGGGGLLAGVVEGLHRNGLANVHVLAVETEGASSLFQSVRLGYRVELPAITSIATSLGAKMVCEKAFDLARSHPTKCCTVSDLEALAACEAFLDDHRLLVEPACGAALALAYSRSSLLSQFERILIVVCGGATATIGQQRIWADAIGRAESR